MNPYNTTFNHLNHLDNTTLTQEQSDQYFKLINLINNSPDVLDLLRDLDLLPEAGLEFASRDWCKMIILTTFIFNLKKSKHTV